MSTEELHHSIHDFLTKNGFKNAASALEKEAKIKKNGKAVADLSEVYKSFASQKYVIYI